MQEKFSKLTGNVASSVKTSMASAAQRLQDIPVALVVKVFPERSVPVFLVPTGRETRDFDIVFDFTQQIDALKAGFLARPNLKVWTGQTDFDRERFARQFRQEFSTQFLQTFQKEKENIEAKLTDVETQLTKAAEGFRKETVRALRNAVLVLILTPVILDLLFFNWALDSTARSVAHFRALVRLGSDRRSLNRELKRKRNEMERQFAEREKAIHRAIKRLSVSLHPQLSRMRAELFDTKPSAEPELTSTDFPDIRDHPVLALRYPRLLNIVERRWPR